MSQKHYEALAAEIKAQSNRHAARVAALIFCNVASADNPRFDRFRFLAACGLTAGTPIVGIPAN